MTFAYVLSLFRDSKRVSARTEEAVDIVYDQMMRYSRSS